MSQRLTERVHILMSQAEVRAIDDWRFPQRVDSRGEAIRRLVDRGLQTPGRAPTAQSDETAQQVSAPARPSGGYPWEAAEKRNATMALNVAVRAPLKLQLDWIVRLQNDAGRQVTEKQVVEEMLEQYVTRELRRFRIEL